MPLPKSKNNTPINHVSDTAVWVATFRAMETQRADALFQDPLASLLVGERGPQIVRKMKTSQPTGWAVVIRTCIIDEIISRAISQGVDTILNLGAGLDTRPYRLSLPSSLRWIEVDYSHMIEFKEEQLKGQKPHCRLERFKLDLADVPARQKLFDSINSGGQKIFVLTEGVIPYLDNDQVAELARDLHACDHIKFWLLDYFSRALVKYMSRGRIKSEMRNAPFKFAPPDWFKFFEDHQWKATEIRYMGDEAERLKRPFVLPFWARFLMKFASREKQKKFNRMSGYVLLEPR